MNKLLSALILCTLSNVNGWSAAAGENNEFNPAFNQRESFIRQSQDIHEALVQMAGRIEQAGMHNPALKVNCEALMENTEQLRDIEQQILEIEDCIVYWEEEKQHGINPEAAEGYDKSLQEKNRLLEEKDMYTDLRNEKISWFQEQGFDLILQDLGRYFDLQTQSKNLLARKEELLGPLERL